MTKFLIALVTLGLTGCSTGGTKDNMTSSDPDSLYHYAVDSILRADIENKDYDKARKMLEVAIDSGHVESMTYLGADLLYGWSFGHDEEKGVAYLMKAAEMKSTTAMHYLATSYFNKSNMDSSILYLRKCSDLNDAICSYTLGYLLLHGDLPIGKGKIEPNQTDQKAGIQLLGKAASNGQPDAQLELGRCYITGVDKFLSPDTAKAKELLLKVQEHPDYPGIGDIAEELLQRIQ